MEIFLAYEKGSGQTLNKQKTMLYFNPNTSLRVKNEVQRAAGGVTCGYFEKYLGLPAMVGRKKHSTFKWLKERVWQKINN